MKLFAFCIGCSVCSVFVCVCVCYRSFHCDQKYRKKINYIIVYISVSYLDSCFSNGDNSECAQNANNLHSLSWLIAKWMARENKTAKKTTQTHAVRRQITKAHYIVHAKSVCYFVMINSIKNDSQNKCRKRNVSECVSQSIRMINGRFGYQNIRLMMDVWMER